MVNGFSILFPSFVSPLYLVFAVDMSGNKVLFETYLTYKIKIYISKDTKQKKGKNLSHAKSRLKTTQVICIFLMCKLQNAYKVQTHVIASDSAEDLKM